MTAGQSVCDAINALVDAYRTRCLWYLRPDYYPLTDDARRRVLDAIASNGDRDAFVRAAALRQWLSLPSNERSAVS